MGNISQTVFDLVKPYADNLGLSLWDVCFVKEGAEHYLRIFIDKEGGVSIDDCVDLSHAIDKPIDDADPISCAYTLEVSSPGVERLLKTPEHFEKMKGRKVKIKTIRTVDDERDFSGILENYENGVITVRCDDKVRTFDKKELSWVKLDDFDD